MSSVSARTAANTASGSMGMEGHPGRVSCESVLIGLVAVSEPVGVATGLVVVSGVLGAATGGGGDGFADVGACEGSEAEVGGSTFKRRRTSSMADTWRGDAFRKAFSEASADWASCLYWAKAILHI